MSLAGKYGDNCFSSLIVFGVDVEYRGAGAEKLIGNH
jgi:hypothetical protein